jgi:hypothetical protein
LPPEIGWRAALTPIPEKTTVGMTILRSPESRFPAKPVIPAGLLAIMLGSSVDTAAPAKAVPNAAALFSRTWKPAAKASPGIAKSIAAKTKAAASLIRLSYTAFPHCRCRCRAIKLTYFASWKPQDASRMWFSPRADVRHYGRLASWGWAVSPVPGRRHAR